MEGVNSTRRYRGLWFLRTLSIKYSIIKLVTTVTRVLRFCLQRRVVKVTIFTVFILLARLYSYLVSNFTMLRIQRQWLPSTFLHNNCNLHVSKLLPFCDLGILIPSKKKKHLKSIYVHTMTKHIAQLWCLQTKCIKTWT